MQEILERLLQVWASFRSLQGFSSRNRVFGSVSRHGAQAAGSCLVAIEFLVLCRDMVLRLQAVARSRHSIFMLQ